MAKADKPLKYDANHIIGVHGLSRGLDCEILEKLESARGVIESEFTVYLENHRQALRIKGEYWNEEELKMNFVALVFFVAKLNVPKQIRVFYERKLNGEVDGIPISVKVDGMLATPTNANRPRKPYFFLQEFKRSLGDDHDPEGQMLAAMILAQELNKDGKPLYGCWLQGKNWNFTTLINRDYCVSKQFDATDMVDLQHIVFILRKLKDLILDR